MAYDTAANIINDAAVELGLLPFSGKVADPFGATDPNLGQLCQLLKRVGRDLVKRRAWTLLTKEATLVTIQGTAQYDLPADYSRSIAETEWNRTNRLPTGGPLRPEEWQYLKGQLVGVVFNVLYRIEGGKILLFPDVNTPGGYTLAYEYVSSWWVQPVGQAAPTTETPATASDTLWFDPLLLVSALKLAWKREKGLDTTSAQADFDDAYEQACNADTPGRALQIGQSTARHPRFLGSSNIPITGVGG